MFFPNLVLLNNFHPLEVVVAVVRPNFKRVKLNSQILRLKEHTQPLINPISCRDCQSSNSESGGSYDTVKFRLYLHKVF